MFDRKPLKNRRSFTMYEELKACEYKVMSHEVGNYLELGEGNLCRVLDGNVTSFDEPLISIGASITAREWILLDTTSPYLTAKYALLEEEIKKAEFKDIESVLNHTMHFVRGYFHHDENVKEKIESITQDSENVLFLAENETPVVSLDTFIQYRRGICRHHSLFIAFLLDQLIKNALLAPGNISHYRTELEGEGAHAFVMYRPHQTDTVNTVIYLVDSLWNEQAYQLVEYKNTLILRYGKSVIAECLHRYNKLNVETVPYSTKHSIEIKNRFLQTLLNAMPERRRKLLNHQYSLNGCEDLQADMITPGEIVRVINQGHPAFKHLQMDLARILKTQDLHKMHFMEIEESDDRQQFILGLLSLPKDKQIAILATQNENDLQRIEKTLSINSLGRGQLFIQFESYQTVLHLSQQKPNSLSALVEPAETKSEASLPIITPRPSFT